MAIRRMLLSSGIEAGVPPAWIIVDDQDCAEAGVEFFPDDEPKDAVRRLIETKQLPEGSRFVGVEELYSPHGWQHPDWPDCYLIETPDTP